MTISEPYLEIWTTEDLFDVRPCFFFLLFAITVDADAGKGPK